MGSDSNQDYYYRYGYISGNSTDIRDIPYAYPNTSSSSISIKDIYGFSDGIDEKIRFIKEVEALKIEHKVEDFHIIFDGKYFFITEQEMDLLKKYSVSFTEIADMHSFNIMLKRLQEKTHKAVLTLSGGEYTDLEDLRKDYLVLKLSGIDE